MTCNVIQGILGCYLILIPTVHLCCRDRFWFALWNIYVRVAFSAFVLFFDILVWNVLIDSWTLLQLPLNVTGSWITTSINSATHICIITWLLKLVKEGRRVWQGSLYSILCWFDLASFKEFQASWFLCFHRESVLLFDLNLPNAYKRHSLFGHVTLSKVRRLHLD